MTRWEDPALTALAPLGDDLRRALFDFVRRARRPVTREEAAADAGISRKLAAFHLDKLVEAGLLAARPQPPDGPRRVGRAPKVYEPAGEAIEVSIPPRRYGMLADILADAVLAETEEQSAFEAALRIAGQRGVAAGSAERDRVRPGRLSAERGLTVAAEALADFGFEPERTSPTLVRLRNCPFHAVAAKAPALACGINHAFLAGYLDGLGSAKTDAVLAPSADACCVQLCGAESGDAAAGEGSSGEESNGQRAVVEGSSGERAVVEA